MSMPLPRMTTRRWMLAVAVVGYSMGFLSVAVAMAAVLFRYVWCALCASPTNHLFFIEDGVFFFGGIGWVAIATLLLVWYFRG